MFYCSTLSLTALTWTIKTLRLLLLLLCNTINWRTKDLNPVTQITCTTTDEVSWEIPTMTLLIYRFASFVQQVSCQATLVQAAATASPVIQTPLWAHKVNKRTILAALKTTLPTASPHHLPHQNPHRVTHKLTNGPANSQPAVPYYTGRSTAEIFISYHTT
jgi:hypothetical protein